MKKYFAAFAIITMVYAFPAFANERLAQNSKTPVYNDHVFAEMAKLSVPNDMQLLLANLVGEWDYSVTVWDTSGAEPQQSTGTSMNAMILDGRFISLKSSGILNVGGHYMPFESEGLMGYDNLRKVFSSVWIDTLNPGMMTGSGSFDKETKVIKESGNFTSAASKASRTYRSELHLSDAKIYKRIIFSIDESGKEFKIMEFVYRKKR